MNTLSYKTKSANKETVEKEWFVVDATDLVLGRLASNVARVLRGKHKPSFTPHVDCGDNVIIINAEKVKLTGKKWDEKEYQFYSGHPGGQKVYTAKDLQARDPRRIVEMAVKGMLPKNKLGRKIYGNLTVVVGAEHKHEAQSPKELKF